MIVSDALERRLTLIKEVRSLIETEPRALCTRVGCSSTTCLDRKPRGKDIHCLHLSAFLFYRYLRETVGIPERYINATLENTESDFKSHPEQTCFDRAVAYVRDYRENLRLGRNVLLAGALGSGKTYLATALAQALIDRGVDVLWRTADGIVSEIMAAFDHRDGSAEEIRQRFYNVSVLVIDEFGASIGTDAGRIELMSVINNRYNLGRVMFVTHNLKSSTLKTLPSDYFRMWDRLVHRSEKFVLDLRSYRHS